MRIFATRLDVSTTHPKLSLISPTLTTGKTKIGNQGTSIKTSDIAPCTDLYRNAPSGKPGRAVLSSSRNTPRDLVQAEGTAVLRIEILERHPYTTQAFTPMGGDSERAYMVVVADSLEDGSPDVSSIKAYAMKGNEGICYVAGVWHAPMAVIGQVRAKTRLVADIRLSISRSFST